MYACKLDAAVQLYLSPLLWMLQTAFYLNFKPSYSSKYSKYFACHGPFYFLYRANICCYWYKKITQPQQHCSFLKAIHPLNLDVFTHLIYEMRNVVILKLHSTKIITIIVLSWESQWSTVKKKKKRKKEEQPRTSFSICFFFLI